MVLQHSYCKEHYITWDSTKGVCPICALEGRVSNNEIQMEIIGNAFNNAEELFKQILIEVKKSGH